MIDLFSWLTLQNIMPADWPEYLPFIGGFLGLFVIMSIVILLLYWVKKRSNSQNKLINTDSNDS